MSTFPFQKDEIRRLFNRLSKIKPSTILEREQSDPRDVISRSNEAKKRRILDQTRSEVLETIRKTR
jgi:hypothetical protein